MTTDDELNINALDDADLKEVAGGANGEDPDVTVAIRDAKGRQVGYRPCKSSTQIYYWKCTHCGNPVHKSTQYYCDACDDWWFSRRNYLWSGTEAELIAAAN